MRVKAKKVCPEHSGWRSIVSDFPRGSSKRYVCIDLIKSLIMKYFCTIAILVGCARATNQVGGAESTCFDLVRLFCLTLPNFSRMQPNQPSMLPPVSCLIKIDVFLWERQLKGDNPWTHKTVPWIFKCKGSCQYVYVYVYKSCQLQTIANIDSVWDCL